MHHQRRRPRSKGRWVSAFCRWVSWKTRCRSLHSNCPCSRWIVDLVSVLFRIRRWFSARSNRRPLRSRDRTIGCTGDLGAVGSGVGINSSVPVILGVLASGIQYIHDALFALKRINIEGHIDVDRDVGSAFAVAKKWWAEKRSHEPPSLPFFCPPFFCPSISNLKLRFL